MKSASVLVWALGALNFLFGAGLAPCAAGEMPRKPNIVLILADDLGYGELGVQGYRQDIPTPGIDSIARHGVRFTAGYVSAPLCSPTRAGLMTGRYQQRFGHEFNKPDTIPDEDFGLARAETTLADRLKALGYATGLVGKWHLGLRPGAEPAARGFDEFFGFMRAMHGYFPTLRPGAPILRGSVPVEERDYLTDAFAREAVSFVERYKDRPFFLYLSFNSVHSPLQAPERSLRRFDAIRDPKRRTFAAMLAAMDDAVGRLLTKLDQLGLSRNTLIFFLSDNGGPTEETTSSNGMLRGRKGQVFEGGIRVPFLMQWKDRLPPGKREDFPVISLDVFPTAIAAAGGTIERSWNLDGVDLLPYLSGRQSGRPHDTLFWRMGQKYAVRSGDWKLVREQGMPVPALYDLVHDPAERNDLAPKLPARVKELDARYAAWSSQMVRPSWEPSGRPMASKQSMQSFDRDRDGRLTPDEFPRPRRFHRLDANRDGVLTEREFSGQGRAGRESGEAGRHAD